MISAPSTIELTEVAAIGFFFFGPWRGISG
jgi:hypothetical protein